jgi:hypothetical protein
VSLLRHNLCPFYRIRGSLRQQCVARICRSGMARGLTGRAERAKPYFRR